MAEVVVLEALLHSMEWEEEVVVEVCQGLGEGEAEVEVEVVPTHPPLREI